MAIKILELREITDWRVPVYVKIGATRTYYDVALAVKAGADVVTLDGMQGGTGATQDVFIEHVGIPTMPALRLAVEALVELDMHRKVQLIVSGGIRSGADVAKALAMGADAVAIGVAALIALGDNAPEHGEGYAKIGSAAGFYDDYQWYSTPRESPPRSPNSRPGLIRSKAAGDWPTTCGRSRSRPRRSRACGKSHLHNLEPEDLVALTIEAAAMARVPAGTSWIPGQ